VALENRTSGTSLVIVNKPVERRATERRAQSGRPLPSHRQWTPLGRSLSVVGDNWTLAIVTELAGGQTRLAALRERLAGVSASVLDRYLQRMRESGLVTRERFREMPPRVEFKLTEAGRELLPIAAALSTWGLRWSWSEPDEGEIVDPGALLRALPALLDGPLKAPDGAVELILDERGGRRRHVVEIVSGEVRMWIGEDDARIAPEITATVAGDWRAWAGALGPGGDLSSLTLSGRRNQARRLLAAVVRPRAEQGGESALGHLPRRAKGGA
jgi:DNA-binding HxlR family transcriptional regulator